MNDALRQMIVASANKLGISPVDLATVISYETGGTFDPTQPGPRTKWGQHKGLIQWGEPQAQKYLGGDFSVPRQGEGIVAYMQDAGVRPGMGLLDVYSAVNAGKVGRYNASDEAAGGAPGTVRDKVENQMAGHRRRAEAMFGPAAANMQQRLPGDSMVARDHSAQVAGQTNTPLFGSMAPAKAGPTPLMPDITSLPGHVMQGMNPPKTTPGDRIAGALGSIELMPAPRPGPFPGGPSPEQANALLSVLGNPSVADMLLKKRLV